MTTGPVILLRSENGSNSVLTISASSRPVQFTLVNCLFVRAKALRRASKVCLASSREVDGKCRAPIGFFIFGRFQILFRTTEFHRLIVASSSKVTEPVASPRVYLRKWCEAAIWRKRCTNRDTS